jgi:hypothetical protein
MGASESKSSKVTDIVNQTTTEVMANISTSAQSSTKQSNKLTISNIHNSTLSDITQLNESKIVVTAVAEASQSGELQSKLSAALADSLTQNSNAIGYSSSDINIDTAIKNIVSNRITTNSVNEAFSGISQENALDIVNINNSKISRISQTNIGEAIATLMSATSTDIVAALGIEAESKTEAEQTTTNPVSSIASAIGAAVGGNMIFILIIIAAAAFGFYMFKDQVMTIWNAYYPYDLYALIALAGSLVVISLI